MRRFVYSAFLVILLAAGIRLLAADPFFTELQTLTRAVFTVDQKALFADDPEQIKYGVAYGMVSILDDYSTWHDRVTDTLIRRESRGHYGGFGIEIIRFGDTTVVWQVFPESPAQEAGLLLGDRLLAADSVSLLGLALDSVHLVLASMPGDMIDLQIYRPGDRSLHTFASRRARIEVSTVRVWARKDNLAYLAISSFNARTSDALSRALDTLTEAGAEKFIIDLRGNPGGLLQTAVECAELFLPRPGPVVHVSGQGPDEEIDGDAGPYPTQPLVLLVDGYSASGSELLAGCLQDWDRAVLVGSPTFGKGFVQNLFWLNDRSSLRLTIGRYLTPSGRTFYRPDSTRAPDTSHFRSLVYSRPLLGGGQIFPDVTAAELECPAYAGALVRGRDPFDFVAEMLGLDPIPPLDSELALRFWDRFEDNTIAPVTTELAAALPEDVLARPEWSRRIEELAQRERAFDQAQMTDCLLAAIARHLGRAGHDVPLLDEPLLPPDPVLAKAVEILDNPEVYEGILRGSEGRNGKGGPIAEAGP